MDKCNFLCKIAELITVVPAAGGLPPRCTDYLCDSDSEPDIVILPERYKSSLYSSDITENDLAYMESARQFYSQLLKFNGLYLHSSAVVVDGRAYLFSGPSGRGKSTHTSLWCRTFGDAAQIINDDKPALRLIDGCWYAYGTPWCGKDGINQNKKVPLAGICFLEKADVNEIRRLSKREAIEKILTQTFRKFKTVERLDKMLDLLERLVCEIPVFELKNKPEPEAARLSYETMHKAATEALL